MRKIIWGALVAVFISVAAASWAQTVCQTQILNIELADPAVWYRVDCADQQSGVFRVKNVNIRGRQGAGDLHLAFDPQGECFFTIPEGSVYFEQGVGIPMVFYLRGANENAVAEVLIYR